MTNNKINSGKQNTNMKVGNISYMVIARVTYGTMLIYGNIYGYMVIDQMFLNYKYYYIVLAIDKIHNSYIQNIT